MHICKYGPDYARRHFLDQMTRGVLTAGVLHPVWSAVADNGEFTKSYPDELLSIEEFTKGRLKPGDFIDESNVDLVKDLLDPIRYHQITQMGRRLELVESSTDITKLSPVDYIEATRRNKGRAQFDENSNVVTDEGKPWIGGNPFPEPTSALEIFAGITLTWGRHDVSLYAIKEHDIDKTGELKYRYELFWTEFAPVGRVTIDPKPYWPGHEDKLRYNSLFFVKPNDYKGTSFLNIWHYDQRRSPDLMGYVPQFKRVRRFPANQRFEPLIPGSTLYLSDVWTAGDPYLIWGNYKIIGRGPFLGGLSGNWNSEHPNWEHTTHGGPKGQTFWDMKVELLPEVIIVEAEPTHYARAPISKKRVWFDARTLLPANMITYDRRGEVFKSFEGGADLYEHGDKRVMDGSNPYWSWCMVHAFNMQSNHMTRIEQVREVSGGHHMRVNEGDIYEELLTVQALRRFGT